MLVGIGAEGAQVVVGCIAGNLATGADDITGTCLLMTGGDGVADGGRGAVTKGEHWMKIAQQDLIGAHRLARLIQRGEVVQIHDLTSQPSESIQAVTCISTDVKSDPGAERVETVDEFFFVGPDELFVESGAHERSGCIADADEIDAGVDLSFGEAEFQVDDKFKQVIDENGIIIEIKHERIDAAQVAAFGTRPLNPAFDNHIFSDTFTKERDGLHAVVHATAAEGIGRMEGGEPGFVSQERALLIQCGRLVIEELDSRATVSGFASWIGHGVDVIEAKLFGGADLGFGEQAMIGAVVAVADAREIGGKHHRDRHERQVIDRMSIEVGKHTFTTIHGNNGVLQSTRAARYQG
jgi:hypothetical protein